MEKLLVDRWKESCPATAVAAVDDDGGGGWRLEATVDGDGREVGWGQNIDGGGGRAASLPSGGCAAGGYRPNTPGQGSSHPPENPAQISFEFLFIKTHTEQNSLFLHCHKLMLFSQCYSRLLIMKYKYLIRGTAWATNLIKKT